MTDCTMLAETRTSGEFKGGPADLPVSGCSSAGRGVGHSRQTIEQNVLDALVFRGLLSQKDMEAALGAVRDNAEDLEALLLDRFRVSKMALGRALSDFYQCPYLPYDERTVLNNELFKTLNADYLKKNLWLPISRQGSIVDVLTVDLHDMDKGWDVRRTFPGSTIRYSVGLRRDIEQFLTSVKRSGRNVQLGTVLDELFQESPVGQIDDGEHVSDEDHSVVIRLVNHFIVEAERIGASDIHIEPYADRKATAVRFRVDGSCLSFMTIPAVYRRAVVSRLKIMANLDIAERRKPQDGKIR